jgi:hypothetical protein
MTAISELVGTEIEWVQPSALKMNYELRSGEERLAALRFRSSWGTFATAESPEGCWTFKRVGFWQTRVTIRACSTEDELAVFRHNTWSNGGTLEFPDGRTVRATTNFWQTRLEWSTESGEALLRFHTHGLVKLAARVEILPAGSLRQELAWMVCLGWYLIIMMYNDSAAASSAVSASA